MMTTRACLTAHLLTYANENLLRFARKDSKFAYEGRPVGSGLLGFWACRPQPRWSCDHKITSASGSKQIRSPPRIGGRHSPSVGTTSICVDLGAFPNYGSGGGVRGGLEAPQGPPPLSWVCYCKCYTFSVFLRPAISFPIRHQSHAQSHLKQILGEELNSIQAAGTWKNERIITSMQGVTITAEGSQGELLNFCANNYLGLSSHPEIIEASQKALKEFGAGLSSVRFICGTQSLHKELESMVAQFHGRSDAILYPSCFDANAGLFEALVTPDDAIISDELNHASIIDGIRLCKGKKLRYKHRDMVDLDLKLQEVKDARLKFIVTDGVFSMDGNVAPLPDICKLAEKYEALTIVDEAHATGFFGRTGRGTEEFFNMLGKVDIINSTLGKALGGASGGYTTGPSEVVQLLRQRGRPYLFSNALPPPVVAAGIKALDILMSSSKLLEAVMANTRQFRDGMSKAGFTIGGENHPICPVMLGDAKLANTFTDKMLKKGIYVIGFSYPVVPKGKARIRVQLSAAHSPKDIDKAITAFVDIGKQLSVI
uniref:2-amino-3-ketobutyrate coenzyme A ligase, mitochondrial n=1 Tax=Timema shepardi TaxID=629360 RepID=A0A7R9AW64_TIMSH|nr:unnamed protein product [Timema shepardi]